MPQDRPPATARLALLLLSAMTAPAAAADRPNVLLVITDDQGYGDLGLHGNPIIRTPNLDALGKQSLRLTHFRVSPVCAPTRASLFTGRYNYRTGVVDTAYGRAMMDPSETTLAQLLAGAGYRTGIFGKWHLGDCYPLRPTDRGFSTSLVHLGGGIGQPSDPPGGTSYFDPVLFQDGRPKKYAGYCTDIFTDAALDFVDAKSDAPFFAHVAYNCPHTPLEVPDGYRKMYEGGDTPADTAKIYGMVTNIDDNVGRLLRKLDERKLADNTLVIFLTDNGPQQQQRYNADLRGRKGGVYDGGLRVPFFARWPGRVAPRADATFAAHIDVLPTLLDACAVPKPAGLALDGVSLWPLWSGAAKTLPERTLFFQWHRGDRPELYRNCAAVAGRWKFVQSQPQGVVRPPASKPELFDLSADPLEQRDLSAEHPEVLAMLKTQYENWFRDVTTGRGDFLPPDIVVGSERENPVTLTRQDWRGPRNGWTPDSLGYWHVRLGRGGTYRATVRVTPRNAERRGVVRLAGVERAWTVAAGAAQVVVELGRLAAAATKLEAELVTGKEPVGVHQVVLERVGD